MKALVTGITGFVGSHLAEHLLACGDQLIGTGLNAAWENASVPEPLRDIELHGWDLAHDPTAALRDAVEAFRPDSIYHLAAISIPALCGDTEPTDLARQVNVDGTRRVISMAKSLPNSPRVLVVSSADVYGRADPAASRVSETVTAQPYRGYGKTKLAAEQVAMEAVRAGEADCVIARPFNHTGPGQSPELMLPEWAKQFAEGVEPIVVHTLNAWLDLSDARDIVRAYRLLVKQGQSGEVYNIGSGIKRRSGDLFQRLRDLAGGNARFSESRPGEKHQPIADCEKLRAATGWRPEISLWKTIEDTYHDWCYRTTPNR